LVWSASCRNTSIASAVGSDEQLDVAVPDFPSHGVHHRQSAVGAGADRPPAAAPEDRLLSDSGAWR
jgi:hypothetical protein